MGHAKSDLRTGFLQVGLCGALLTFAGIYILNLPKEVAFIAGMGFTLSSTAIVMQVLEERGITNTPKGQRVISTLILKIYPLYHYWLLLPFNT